MSTPTWEIQQPEKLPLRERFEQGVMAMAPLQKKGCTLRHMVISESGVMLLLKDDPPAVLVGLDRGVVADHLGVWMRKERTDGDVIVRWRQLISAAVMPAQQINGVH